MRNVLALLVILVLLTGCEPKDKTLVLATTTSTADSGLLDAIIPAFEKAECVTVQVLAVGTGEAISIGERGDADVLLVHDRAREDKFMADGFGSERRDVMYNDFVLVGPLDDPAGVASLASAPEAFAQLTRSARPSIRFVSRGDRSGTHSKDAAHLGGRGRQA